ncbi:trans-sialidase, putative [Trypanosoma cruzi marinkellei]|uniref:Trans-sialidase, putative n=1 Tax=Trypanosoma cruzi marinkellei TaxID=85056 RepID=K2MRM3_TRYCR|nr:trans-sialidase, putative [Trypanosoma cruzi marinkellei]
MSEGGCSDSSVVEWEKGKLIMMTACDDGRRRVHEINAKEDSWTEALGTLARVWSNKQKGPEKAVGSGFITATVGDDMKKVMLVTLPVYSKDGNKNEANEKGKLHLWLTDTTHIVDVGPVSGKEDDFAASSLLYKRVESGTDNNEELIAPYKKKGDGKPHNLWSVRLTERLVRVKKVLSTWKKVDGCVSKLRPTSSAAESTSTATACSAGKITDGLVVFLSGNFSESTWRDECLGVNAIVTKKDGAQKADNGVTFTGAEWPVGRQGENQLYHFANYNFTLVATVFIYGVLKSGSVPLMGVKTNGDGGEKKLMELSYDSEKKWQVLCSDEKNKEHSSTWVPQKQYQVAIVLRNGTQGSVYVDGQRVCMGEQREMREAEPKEISHFYIEGDGDSADNKVSREVSVTATNVLLYNRPLKISVGNADLEEDFALPSGAPVVQSANTEQLPPNPSQRSVGKAEASYSHAVGEATGDGDALCVCGLLPSLLLLLGLWVFATL